MPLKIVMYPAFMSECLFEFKCGANPCRLLIVKSALPGPQGSRREDRGAAFNLETTDQEATIQLRKLLFRFVEYPTPKTSVVIADGIAFKISYSSPDRSFQTTLSSIQEHSIELEFVHCLFEICLALVPSPDFKSYLEEVKRVCL